MGKSIENRMREVDTKIVGLYNLAKVNGDKSASEIIKQICLINNQTFLEHSKEYTFQCRS